MNDLTNTTFIIPILVESEDRYNNVNLTLRYLNHHFKTNVILYEVCDQLVSKLDFLNELSNLNLVHIKKAPEESFHRTKYLNEMLDQVKTSVVVNYDIDIILPVDTYLLCENLIQEGKYTVIYPYGFSKDSQVQVFQSFNRDEFLRSFDLTFINPRHSRRYVSAYGFCIFFNTDIYRENGGENENFISYGPEDVERGERFYKLDYSPVWLADSLVYHFEHRRGSDSSSNNPYFRHNELEYEKLRIMDKQSLINYYRSQDYLHKYKNIK